MILLSLEVVYSRKRAAKPRKNDAANTLRKRNNVVDCKSCALSVSCHHRYISSNGLVSRKQLDQTSFTTLPAVSSSGQFGLFLTECTARLRTQSWWWFVKAMILFRKNSFAHLHSPLKLLARICTFCQLLPPNAATFASS